MTGGPHVAQPGSGSQRRPLGRVNSRLLYWKAKGLGCLQNCGQIDTADSRGSWRSPCARRGSNPKQSSARGHTGLQGPSCGTNRAARERNRRAICARIRVTAKRSGCCRRRCCGISSARLKPSRPTILSIPPLPPAKPQLPVRQLPLERMLASKIPP